jgi:hypothetical protein
VHPAGVKGFVYRLLVPHTHDAHDSIDDALEASAAGIRAVKISLLGLSLTAGLQIIVVIISGSVALLADTIHNFADALTAVPLWIAFALSRRPATPRYTYGYGRVEDLAGLFIVIMITASALLAGYESIRRFFEPQPVANLLWVLIAGVIGFLGNEVVAVYRIRVGRRIGSAALVADGIHARTDSFTSFAVVLGVIGIWLGFGHPTTGHPSGPRGWDELVDDLGLSGLVRHGLRHTALTWMADAGVELHMLQRVAGHQDPAVTSRYLHPDHQAVLDVGAAYARWWAQSGPNSPALRLVEDGPVAG